MFLNNLSAREKNLFYVTIGIIALSLLIVAFKPLGDSLDQLNRQIAEKELKLKKNNRYLAQKNKIEKILRSYRKYIQPCRGDDTEATALLNEVEKQARAAGIRIVNILPKLCRDMQYYKKCVLELNCEAKMEDFINFAYHLQTSERLIGIDELKLASQGSGSSLLKARVLISKALISE